MENIYDTIFAAIEAGYRHTQIEDMLVEGGVSEKDAQIAIRKTAQEIFSTLSNVYPNAVRVYANISVLESIARDKNVSNVARVQAADKATTHLLRSFDLFNEATTAIREANVRLQRAKADIAEAVAAATRARHHNTVVVVPDLASLAAIQDAEKLPAPEAEKYNLGEGVQDKVSRSLQNWTRKPEAVSDVPHGETVWSPREMPAGAGRASEHFREGED